MDCATEPDAESEGGAEVEVKGAGVCKASTDDVEYRKQAFRSPSTKSFQISSSRSNSIRSIGSARALMIEERIARLREEARARAMEDRNILTDTDVDDESSESD